MSQLDLIATATFGLEAVVKRELEALGYACRTLQNGRVLFQGDAAAIARANLWLRASDRVLLRMGSFTATDFEGNTCTDTVEVEVAHDRRGDSVVNQGPLYDSTSP